MNNNFIYDAGMYVLRSTLHSRYLMDDTWVARLGPRDKHLVNPYRPSGSPMSAYRVARVEAFLEAHAGKYAEYLVFRAKHSNVLTAEAEWQEHEILEWAWRARIEHRPWPDDLWQTCRAHLESLCLSGLPVPVPEVSMERIHGMLRHEYTNYEALLADTNGTVGAPDACAILKQRANSELAARLYAYGMSVSNTADRIAV